MSNEDDVGFLYKTMIERDPKKRRVKPVETAHTLLDFDLGESSDDSDFRIEDHCEDSDDDSVDSNDAGKETADDDDESSDSDDSLKNTLTGKDSGQNLSTVDLIQEAGCQNATNISLQEKMAKMLVCCGCLGDRSDDVNEIVECDGCGITVHEGCYGVSDVESFSSADSLCQSAPWFCEACSAGVEDPECELCPNKGGIFKETDVGKWVHLICALYVPGVAFGEVDRLTSVTLFEMPYNRWGAKACSLCDDIRFALTGVCIECDAGMCHTYFHVTCAQRNGLLSEAHSEEADHADPFYAHCKLHSDKNLVRKRKRNWLALQLRSKHRMELLKQPEYKDTEEYKRIQRKLAKHRQKYLTHKISKAPPWVPTQRMPRFLGTSAFTVRSLQKKAQLMGIDLEAVEAQEAQIASLVDIRKKWHIPPGFNVEFVSYYIDRVNRGSSMKKKLEELIQANKQLVIEQQELDKQYDDKLKVNEDEVQLFNVLKEQIELYHKVLRALSYSKPLPLVSELCKPKTQPPTEPSVPSIVAIKKNIIESQSTKGTAAYVSKQPSVKNEEQNHLAAVTTLRHQCGICRRATDQHLLAKCDTCQLHYHLGCLTPPLTRMPKKSKIFGWQCSECDKESSDSEIEQIDTSAPRKLRHCKEDNSSFNSSSINDSFVSPKSEVFKPTPVKKTSSKKSTPVIQNNHESTFVPTAVPHTPRLTIKAVNPEPKIVEPEPILMNLSTKNLNLHQSKPEPMQIDLTNDNDVSYNHYSTHDSLAPLVQSTPEYRIATPDGVRKSGKKRRREKHKRYTPDPITGIRQRKHKHKRKSLDIDYPQTNGQDDVPRRITIKIKPIPLPEGKEPSESCPQMFVASSTSTEIRSPKFKKSKIKSAPKQQSHLVRSPLSPPIFIPTFAPPVILPTPLPPPPMSAMNSSLTGSRNSRLSSGSRKSKEEELTDCTVCNLPGTVQNLVKCDECLKCYHFTCLDPPVKKSPKRRGYSWHCADCDPSDLEN